MDHSPSGSGSWPIELTGCDTKPAAGLEARGDFPPGSAFYAEEKGAVRLSADVYFRSLQRPDSESRHNNMN
jgi:hypothetical protein